MILADLEIGRIEEQIRLRDVDSARPERLNALIERQTNGQHRTSVDIFDADFFTNAWILRVRMQFTYAVCTALMSAGSLRCR